MEYLIARLLIPGRCEQCRRIIHVGRNARMMTGRQGLEGQIYCGKRCLERALERTEHTAQALKEVVQ